MNEFSSVLQATGGVGGWAIALAVLATIRQLWPKLKELQVESDGSLRHDLLEEITRLRAENTAERVIHDAKIVAMELKHQASVKEIVERHDRRVHELEADLRGVQDQMRQIIRSLQQGEPNAPTTLAAIISKAYPVPQDMSTTLQDLDKEDNGK